MGGPRTAEAAAAVTGGLPSSGVLFRGDAPPWAPPGAELVQDTGDPAPDRTSRWEAALVDAATVDVVAAVRRLRARSPALQVVIVAPTAGRAAIERALIFAPGIGEVWIEAPDAVDPALLEKAAAVTRQRRRYQVTQSQLREAFSSFGRTGPQTPYISDAYLVALLQVLPDPILSIDDDGRVLSWSPAAEQWLPRLRAGGAPVLRDVVQPQDERAFDEALRDGCRRTARVPLEWLRADGSVGSGELTITPLEVGSHHVRAVILRDTTEQRLAQQQLEEQASELEFQTEQLALQRDELAQLAQARSRFYASMSHEIRTPINAILGYNDLLLAGIYGQLTEQQVTGLERVQAAARHLRELINDALDLSKIESGKIDIVAVPDVDLVELVGEVVATIAPAAAETGVDLHCVLPARCVVETDARRVRQVLLNLLSNAVKFGEGRPVHITAGSRGDDRVFVEVRDHGSGVPADQMDRIFEEFVQLDNGVAGGTGLGLAISRQLAAALGGELRARSRPGKGSAFTLLLPRSAPRE